MPDQTPAVGMERKLAAIFSTAIVGYGGLFGLLTGSLPLSQIGLGICREYRLLLCFLPRKVYTPSVTIEG